MRALLVDAEPRGARGGERERQGGYAAVRQRAMREEATVAVETGLRSLRTLPEEAFETRANAVPNAS
ncbi:MAG: hypothetical protein NVS3B16_05510 [Vulcanimicrobiaceae bacterium]